MGSNRLLSVCRWLSRGPLLVALAGGLFGCDHATKIAAKAALDGSEAVSIVPRVLELRYVENRDIAFSTFSNLGLAPSAKVLAALSVVAIATMAMMLFALRRRAPGDRLSQAGFALALGGGVGNLVDRALRGAVIDFIHVKGWPVFNVADIAVVVGMGLVALAAARRARFAA